MILSTFIEIFCLTVDFLFIILRSRYEEAVRILELNLREGFGNELSVDGASGGG
jgi:hypothetical protein